MPLIKTGSSNAKCSGEGTVQKKFRPMVIAIGGQNPELSLRYQL